MNLGMLRSLTASPVTLEKRSNSSRGRSLQRTRMPVGEETAWGCPIVSSPCLPSDFASRYTLPRLRFAVLGSLAVAPRFVRPRSVSAVERFGVKAPGCRYLPGPVGVRGVRGRRVRAPGWLRVWLRWHPRFGLAWARRSRLAGLGRARGSLARAAGAGGWPRSPGFVPAAARAPVRRRWGCVFPSVALFRLPTYRFRAVAPRSRSSVSALAASFRSFP